LRFWLVCRSCQSRVTKLFCLGSRRSFLCRVCHGLTYMSSRESHKFDAVIAEMRQPGQSRAEALRSLKELRDSLWASWGYRLKK
jgi:CRP-like cAMP-binding protein